MKTTERQCKTNTVSSTKRKAGTGLRCEKSGVSSNKGAKQRLKAAGGNDKEFSEECLLSSTPPLSPVVPTSIQREASYSFQRLKLQLFPIDEVTRRGLEMEKHNPFLELTIGSRKKISSVVKHLNIKWCKSTMAIGELILFPYYAHPDNLSSCRRWTLKDSDTRASDVHVAIGSPAMFRMRYGWFSNVEPKLSNMPLISPFPKRSIQINDNQKKNTDVNEKHPCHLDDSSNQDVNKPIQLDSMAQLADNQRTENSSVLLWDLSNISCGALLSEASKNVNTDTNLVCCDSFDAAIAQYKATVQSTLLPRSSILDAEQTCNAFCFRKITSSGGMPQAQSQDAPIASCIQNVSSRSSGLQDVVGHTQYNACDQNVNGLQLHAPSEACLQPINSEALSEASRSDNSQLEKLEMNWPDSLDHLEYAAPSFRQLIGGESISFNGLIASSVDAFQNFSIFKRKL